jgi:hypothetical protein
MQHLWCCPPGAPNFVSDRELLRDSVSSDDRAQAFEVWTAAGPPRPVSEFWADEPVVDFGV